MSEATALSSIATTTFVKRACDGCHRRKVKCIGDGTRTCKNCSSAGLTCTYNAVPQKKGPKGHRAKVISELRQTQRLTQLAKRRHVLEFDSPPPSPGDLRDAGLLSMDMITTCVNYFFAHMYPTQPILRPIELAKTISQMEDSVEAYCLVVSLCAYMMIQPNIAMPPQAFERLEVHSPSSLHHGHLLLRETVRVRRGCNYAEFPTTWSVITSFFLFGSYFCLDRQNTAWFHLREATTLAQIMGMHDESYYQMSDAIESSRNRRLYWLLFVTERAYALQQHKPLTLYATINLPAVDENPSETVPINGFIHLINLFRPFDDTFVGLWNKARVECTPDWMAALQQQLADALPTYLQCTETQAVDLRCSQQWLRTMVWQLSVSHGFISSVASDHAMSFRFPIEISRDLAQCASQFTRPAMEVHGIGLIEKIFDVACTLTDVMSVVPAEHHMYEFRPREHLKQLVSLISSLRGGQQRYLPLLVQKISDTPGYSITPIPRSVQSDVEELYNGNQGYCSAPDGDEATPYGIPLSSESEPLNGYPELLVTPTIESPQIMPPLSTPPPIYNSMAPSHAVQPG